MKLVVVLLLLLLLLLLSISPPVSEADLMRRLRPLASRCFSMLARPRSRPRLPSSPPCPLGNSRGRGVPIACRLRRPSEGVLLVGVRRRRAAAALTSTGAGVLGAALAGGASAQVHDAAGS